MYTTIIKGVRDMRYYVHYYYSGCTRYEILCTLLLFRVYEILDIMYTTIIQGVRDLRYYVHCINEWVDAGPSKLR